jgi:hypothetical protein
MGEIMPIRKVKGGWTFGGAVYSTRKNAGNSYKAYLAKKHSKPKPKTKRA